MSSSIIYRRMVITYMYVFPVRHGNKRIIVGVDVCQRLSGGTLKLLAYEKFLVDHASTAGRTVLIQVRDW